MATQLKMLATSGSCSNSSVFTLRRCSTLQPRRNHLLVPYASAEPQPQQADVSSPGSIPSSSPTQGNSSLDTNYWHYSRSWPWWQQRAFVVPAGLAFVLLANLMESPSLKTTLIASIPVALLWYLSLVLVPRNFATYCNQWAKTHPEEVERLN
ncbi:hypothetical protein Vretimale_10509 [Volvox reticuliferus]|uniref:Uncharacterized protein n=1 Tax=Volvox reticuliferus TaxID=1737510 RepID=A0A8J4GFW1_9CHLO|nr:hypothetical protein Vretifemale_12451 [Volvox reticuliferus]GIM06095.1 hypothetical protein Vretimale_10509 [Volvox reticuliferus]